MPTKPAFPCYIVTTPSAGEDADDCARVFSSASAAAIYCEGLRAENPSIISTITVYGAVELPVTFGTVTIGAPAKPTRTPRKPRQPKPTAPVVEAPHGLRADGQPKRKPGRPRKAQPAPTNGAAPTPVQA